MLLVGSAAALLVDWPVRWRNRAGAAALLLGLSAIPVWFVALARVHDALALPDPRWMIIMVCGATTAALALWPAALLRTGATARHAAKFTWLLVATISLLVVTQEFAGIIVLEASTQATLIGPGIAMYLARNPALPAVLPLAVLLTYAIAILVASMIVGSLSGLVAQFVNLN